MGSATVEDLNNWIQKMMLSLNINDYEMNIGGNSTKGDGYLGEVTFLNVETKKNGAKHNYDLVIKSAKKSDKLRKQTPVKEAYDRECFFYKTIFPTLDAFQREMRVKNLFDNVAKCYSVCRENYNEAVILQNLKTKGFDLHDRKSAMNQHHVLLVFQNYGRFHALSLALKHKKPQVFNDITRNLSDVMGMFITQTNMITIFHKQFEHLLKLLKDDKQIEALKKYKNFDKQFERILVNCTNEDTVPSVILHGDCWNNNFMFKYNAGDKTKPVDMRFLDFQLSRVGSPILDLSYFFYTCADTQALDNIDVILRAYHSSLSEFLTELGCDANELFPFIKLKEHWREYAKYGLVLALFILKISLCDSEDAPDLIETAESGQDFKEAFQFKILHESVYNDRVKNIFIHFADKFL